MAVNKVVFGAVAIMDISDSTVTPEKLASGVTAYAANGEKITGTMKPKLQVKTVTPTTSVQKVIPDSGYDGLGQVTVRAIPTVTQATPTITVSSSGLITASAIQSAGYVAYGMKSATEQLPTLGPETVTPGTAAKKYLAGQYLTGNITILGDANLLPENIVSGKSIFGVEGTAETGGGGEGGSGSLEACTLTVKQEGPKWFDGTALYCTDADGNECTITSPGTYSIMKHSILYPSDYTAFSGFFTSTENGTLAYVGDSVNMNAYWVRGDCTLSAL